MEHLSTAVMVPPSAMHHSHHYYIDGLAQPFGFGLVVEGLNPVVVNRRALFQRFKSFGYILGIDLSFGAIPPSNDGEAPSKASLATAVIYFDTWDAVERAAKSAVSGRKELIPGFLTCFIECYGLVRWTDSMFSADGRWCTRDRSQ